MTSEIRYLRGAFAAYSPGASLEEAPQFIPFRFNPETLSRSLSVNQGERSTPLGTADKGGEGSGDTNRNNVASSSGALEERFNVQLRFDLDDRHESSKLLPHHLGIAPEIAALESLEHPFKPFEEGGSTGEAIDVRRERPTVLFIWGRLRVLPVRITAMQIHETMFNTELNPVRAEADVSLEVIQADTADKLVMAALRFTHGKRQALARLFHATSVAQGSSLLPL